MNKIIEFLSGLKAKSPFGAKILIMLMIILIAGIGISVPFVVGGVVPTIGAILLDLCALPMFIELFNLWIE